MAVSLV